MKAIKLYACVMTLYDNKPGMFSECSHKVWGATVRAPSETVARRKLLDTSHENGSFIKEFVSIEKQEA